MESSNEGASLVAGKDDIGVLTLSSTEREILDLYDRLQEIQLEVALLKAQQENGEVASHGSPNEEQVVKAQDELLEARATYTLRKDIVDGVMTANPIIKAVHGGTNSTPIEKDLLPDIKLRDATSVSVSRQSSEMQSILVQLTKVQIEAIGLSRENVERTSELLRLTEELHRKRSGATDDPEIEQETRQAKAELKASRQKWKIIKGTASAVVAGSGVDWARDPELCSIVLDIGDEG